MSKKMQMFMTADSGAGGGSLPPLTNADNVLLPEIAGQGVEQDISLEDEYEYVVEGSAEAMAARQSASDEPEELRGKSREEILAALVAERAKLSAEAANNNPVSALQQTMNQLVTQMQPQKAPVTPGYLIPNKAPQMSDKEFEKYINDLTLENPYRAQMEIQARTMGPVIQTFASSQAQLSRELLFANPSTKKVYDKYAQEVEQAVASIPVADRIQNPRVYQTALEVVKARHMEDFVTEGQEERLAAMLDAKLKELGIDPTKPAAKQPQSTYTAPMSAQRPAANSTPKKVVAIPSWVKTEAERKGLDHGFYYEHLKAQGRVK